VGVADVVRAALGEVEDYQRVRINGVEPFTVGGHAAADLAHLLAELLENALLYSPPDEAVDVRGQHQPAGYTLAVIDAGVGMPAGEIAEANNQAGATQTTRSPESSGDHDRTHDEHDRLRAESAGDVELRGERDVSETVVSPQTLGPSPSQRRAC